MSATIQRTLSFEEALQEAAGHHRAGRMGDAEALYQAILQAQPEHPDVNHNLGVLEMQRQRFVAALPWLKAALSANPGYGQYWLTYIEALLLAGDVVTARQVLVEGRSRGLHGPEVDALAMRIDDSSRERLPATPHSEDADRQCQQAESFMAQGQTELAISGFLKSIEESPGWSRPHIFLGILFNDMHRLDEAETHFRRVLEIEPDLADGHYNLGIVLHRQKRLFEAEVSFQQAIRLHNQHINAHNNLGIVLHEQGRFSEAERSFRQALAVSPEHSEALSNLGNTLNELDRAEEALQCFTQAIRLRPDYAEAWNNGGNVLENLGNFELAQAHYDQAMHLQPDYFDANWNKALSGLRFGQFATSWPLYEWRLRRWESPTTAWLEQSSIPRWHGDQSLAGKKILLHAEQGMGDTLHFCRYALRIAAGGAQVFLQVQPPLVTLLQSLGHGIEILAEGASLPKVDFHCPLMSLPMELGTTLDTIPCDVPYLYCDTKKSARWAERLGQKKAVRVGLVWSSGFRPGRPDLWRTNARRNIPLKLLEPLGQIQGMAFVSLQKGEEGEAQLHELRNAGWRGPEILDFTQELHDFSDTAALIDNLDLVLSVDTAVAHLAGALGKPVWIMLKFDACWRWLLDRGDSPWYPTARLIRQKTLDDWTQALSDLTSALENFSSHQGVSAIPHGRQGYQMDAESHHHLGTLRWNEGNLVEAARNFEVALGLEPGYVEAHNSLSLLLLSVGRWREAENRLRHAMKTRSDDAVIRLTLGKALWDAGRLKDAEQHLRESLAICPENGGIMSALGCVLMASGQAQEAEKLLRRAVECSPQEIFPLVCAVRWLDYQPEDPCFAYLGTAYAHRDALFVTDRIALDFAVTRVMGSLGEYTKAFEACTEGNRLHYRCHPYDENEDEQFLQKVRRLYTAELMTQMALLASSRMEDKPADTVDPGDPALESGTPVFIVGLPESGGAIIEQMLSGYPDVVFVTDQRPVEHLVDAVSVLELLLPDVARREASLQSLRNLGRMYLDRVQMYAGKARLLVNVLPDHYRHLGLIHLMLPNAKIIHVLRDPLETCLSCYGTLYTAGQDYAYDLDAVSRHYDFYQQMMQHWHAVLPDGRVLDVYYEDWMTRPELQKQEVCAYLGLTCEPTNLTSASTITGKQSCLLSIARHPDFSHHFSGLRQVLALWRGQVDDVERQTLIVAYGRGDYLTTAEQARAMMIRHPWHVLGWQVRGAALTQLGQAEEAVPILQHALLMDPASFQGHYNLGVALHATGEFEEAAQSFQQAIELNPEEGDAYYNLGITLKETDRFSEAESCFRKALALNPNHADVLNNLGIVLHEQGKIEAAISLFQQALSVAPGHAEAWCNLGMAHQHLGHWGEAEAAFRQSMAQRPDYLQAYVNLGVLLLKMLRLDEAEQCYRQAMAFAENAPEIHCGLGSLQQTRGDMRQAEAHFRRTLEGVPDHAAAYSSLLFCLCHDAEVDPLRLYAEHREYARIAETRWLKAWPRHDNQRDVTQTTRTLQVGFVSGDLRNHPVSVFLEPVLIRLARNGELILHAYYNEMHEDSTTLRLKSCFSRWNRVAHLTDDALFDKIRADGIDILIDLSGHTDKNRLTCFARKPAPLQVSWLGYLGTTGLEAMDYYLASEDFLPIDLFEHLFTEKIIHLPATVPFTGESYAANVVLAVNTLPALENGYLTFGSFNRPNKIGRAVVTLWSALLRELPDARMVLVGMNGLQDVERVGRWFEEEGIAVHRLKFVDRCPLPEYFAYYQQVDICLDAFPYNGSSTTADALWMGVPTMTLSGKTLPSRAGGAWLRHFGLEAFVADDAVQFVEIGTDWAKRLPELAQIRRELRDRIHNTPSCRPDSMARALAFALRSIWQRWCEGKQPVSFAVPEYVWQEKNNDTNNDIPQGKAGV